MMMIMKKQQWMLKVVFSMINSSSSSSSSSISFNNVLRRRRPFCSTTTTTTNTSCCCLSVAPPPPPPHVSNSNINKQQFNILLEKKLPLLIVPYDHVTPIKKVYCPAREDGGGFVCDGTLGFINLFPDDNDDDDDDDQLIIKKKKKKKKKEVYDVYLPEIAKRRICGSSEGWLVTVHENGEFQLLNPLTRVIVHLPPFTTLPRVDSILPPFKISIRDEFIYKVVTNTTTTTTTLPEVVVMAILEYPGCSEKGLAFCRTSLSSSSSTTENIEPTAWIMMPAKSPVSGIFNLLSEDDTIDDEEHTHDDIDTITEVIDGVTHWINDSCSWVDVTFYKENFYTVGDFGMVGVVKGLDGPSPYVQVLLDDHPDHEYHSQQSYLVEYPPPSSSSSSGGGSGGGDLLLVMREIKNIERKKEKKRTQVETEEEEEEEEGEKEIFERPYGTIGLGVWKLNLNGHGPTSWEEVTDLGEDCALFIGYNHSFSFSASKIPGCRGNCIYFTDSQPDKIFVYPDGGHDIGVYNLEDASFEKLNDETCYSQLFMPPPVWYVPN